MFKARGQGKHLGRVHDKGHDDLAGEVGAQVDGGALVQLLPHLLAEVHYLEVPAWAVVTSCGDCSARTGVLQLPSEQQHQHPDDYDQG